MIERDLFFDYFVGCEVGYAIAIGDVRRYKRPLKLDTTYGVRPPQSFLYLADAKRNGTFVAGKSPQKPLRH